MTGKQVLTTWNRCKSIRGTARELGISCGVVKKHLIGYGIYSTPLTEKIAGLRATGIPAKDIADLLGVSSTTVSNNMPYERSSYLSKNKTANAMRIRACRAKNNK